MNSHIYNSQSLQEVDVLSERVFFPLASGREDQEVRRDGKATRWKGPKSLNYGKKDIHPSNTVPVLNCNVNDENKILVSIKQLAFEVYL